MRPTGRWRFAQRRAWKREILVLQIEETYQIDLSPDDFRFVTEWRDAVTADLTVNMILPKPPENAP